MLRRLPLLLCFLLCTVASAQNLTELDNDALLSETAARQARRDTARAQLDSLLEADAESRAEVADRRQRIAALDDPEPPALPANAPAWEIASAELAWLDQRVAVVEAREARRGEIAALLDGRAEQLAALEAAARELAASLAPLEEAWDVVAARLEAGTLETAPEGYAPAELEGVGARLDEDILGWKAEAAALPGALAELREAREADAAALEGLRTERTRAESRNAEAAQRRTLYESFASDDPGSLLGLLGVLVEEWEADAAELEAVEAAAVATADTLPALREALRALTPPNPDEIALEEGPEKWRKAQRQLRLAEARKAYHERRATALAALEQGLQAYVQRLEALLPAVEARFRATLELDVLAATLRRMQDEGRLDPVELPARADAEGLRETLDGLRGQPAALSTGLETLREELAGLLASQERNRATLEELSVALPGLAEDEERERAWAAWSAEVLGMGNRELRASYDEATAALAAGEAAVTAAQTEIEAFREAEEALQQEFFEGIDPMVRKVMLQLEDHRLAILDALRAEQPVPGPPVWDKSGTVGEEDVFKDVVFTGDFFDALEDVRNDFRGRLRYFEEREALVERHTRLLADRETRLRSLYEAQSAVLDAARRAYGAAIVIDTRLRFGGMAAEEEPADLAAAIDRERIRDAEQELAAVASRQRGLAAERAVLLSSHEVDVRLREMIEERLALVVRKLELLRGLREQTASFEESADEVSELEAQRREQAVLFELDEGNAWYESVLLLFESERAAAHTRLLIGYYTEDLELQRKLENIGIRQAKCDLLIRVIRDQQALLGNLEPLVEGRKDQLEVAAEATRLRATALLAADPVGRGAALSELEELLADAPEDLAATFTSAPLEPLLAPDARAAKAEEQADRVFEQQSAFLAYAERLAELRKAGGSARAGHLEAQIHSIEKEKATLLAEKEQLTAERSKLHGRGPEALAALPDYERPSKASERERFVSGDIRWTRDQRLEELIWEAEKTLIWLALIPLIAMILVRVAHSIGHRLVERVKSVEIDDSPDAEHEKREREERATTLFEVFSKAWSILVWVLAGIYLLKALRLDVTPLIASAGIVGLAVAFGAQPLVRDFFAGFFILLEDQYSIGDYVNVDGIGGTVERITLRLTILRDLKGTLHYIPNGNVGRVSNYTKDWARAVIEVGIGYGDDPDLAIAELHRIGQGLRNDPEFQTKILDFSVPGVQSLGDSAVVIRVYIKTRSGEQWAIAREANRRIKKAFDEAGIEIPFPQRTLHIQFEKDADPAAKAVVTRALQPSVDKAGGGSGGSGSEAAEADMAMAAGAAGAAVLAASLSDMSDEGDGGEGEGEGE